MLSGKRKLLVAAAAVVAALVVVGALTGGDDGPDSGGDPGPATLSQAAVDAGCLPVERAQPVPDGGTHRGGSIDYDEAPPNSGEHAPQTLRNAKRFYQRDDNPPPEQAVHNLEHGLVVAWYDDELPDDQVVALREVSARMGSRYVAVPWRRSPFPDNRHFALTAWGRTQRCASVSAEVVREFVEAYADSDDAPEAGYSV